MNMLRTYPLTPGVVRREISDGRPGTYRLGAVRGGTFVPRYFGRSDTVLRQRLLHHAREGRHERFTFRYASEPEQAHLDECVDWHLRLPGATNRYHPHSPRMSGRPCPYCVLGRDPNTKRLARAVASATVGGGAKPGRRFAETSRPRIPGAPA